MEVVQAVLLFKVFCVMNDLLNPRQDMVMNALRVYVNDDAIILQKLHRAINLVYARRILNMEENRELDVLYHVTQRPFSTI